MQHYRLAGLITLVVMIADQISKWFVVERLMRPEGVAETPFFTPEVIGLVPTLDIVMTWNKGVSFGLFNRESDYGPLLLSLLALAIVGGLVMWLRRTDVTLHRVSLGLIIGGALGNLIDRSRWGAVADFIYFHVGSFHWPAFNVADSAITIGAVLLVADSLFARRESSKDSL